VPDADPNVIDAFPAGNEDATKSQVLSPGGQANVAERRLKERELAGKIRANDRQAITTFIAGYLAPAAKLLCFKYRQFNPEYEDVLQDLSFAFCKGDWEKLKAWKGECALLSWAVRIGGNSCFKQARQKKRFETLFKGLKDAFKEGDSADAAQPAEQHDTRVAVLRALEQLDTKDRHVISRFYFDDASLAVISAELETTAAAVTVRKSRALGKLREILSGGLDNA